MVAPAEKEDLFDPVLNLDKGRFLFIARQYACPDEVVDLYQEILYQLKFGDRPLNSLIQSGNSIYIPRIRELSGQSPNFPTRSRIEPLKKVARMPRSHRELLLN